MGQAGQNELERVRTALVGACRAAEGTRLLLAVSGGADSVALTELVSRLSAWPFTVAFVDHGLRDVSAERAASRAAAERADVAWREVALRLKPGGNLQARARAARYRALLALAREDDACVATGHTATDQAETVLARLLRGTGVRGLGGLRPRQGRVIRPLLDVTRAETRALAPTFADDPTNTDPRFTRNRLRALLPLLAGENPQVIEALAALANAARGTTALVTTLVAALERRGGHLETLGLESDPEALAALLHHLASEAGASPSRAALGAWVDAARTQRPTRVPLGDGLFGVIERNTWRVEARPDPRQVATLEGPGLFFAGVAVRLDRAARPGALTLDASGGPWSLVPLPGAQTSQRGLTELDAPVAALLDRTGRTLGRARADGVWEGPRSPPPSETTLVTDCFYAVIETSIANAQSEVVASAEGPLISTRWVGFASLANSPYRSLASARSAAGLRHGEPALIHTSDAPTPSQRTQEGSVTPPDVGTNDLHRVDFIEESTHTPHSDGAQALSNPGCAPTETESSNRHRGREG